jgi:hypothetical protein
MLSYYDKPIPTDENLFWLQDGRNLIRYGRMHPDYDLLQFASSFLPLQKYLRTLRAKSGGNRSPRLVAAVRRLHESRAPGTGSSRYQGCPVLAPKRRRT